MIHLPNKLLFRRGEVMKLLGVSKREVRGFIQAGRLKPIWFADGPNGGLLISPQKQVGKKAYFPRQQVEAIAQDVVDVAEHSYGGRVN